MAKGKKTQNSCSLSKEYLAQTAYLRRTVPQKPGDCFSGQFNGRHETLFTFIICTTGWKVFGRVDKSWRNLGIDNFRQKSIRKVRSEAKLAPKPTVVHIVSPLSQFKWYASTWGTLNGLKFRYCRKLFENSIFPENFRTKFCGIFRKFQMRTECN